jgi:hypothetical protein
MLKSKIEWFRILPETSSLVKFLIMKSRNSFFPKIPTIECISFSVTFFLAGKKLDTYYVADSVLLHFTDAVMDRVVLVHKNLVLGNLVLVVLVMHDLVLDSNLFQ